MTDTESRTWEELTDHEDCELFAYRDGEVRCFEHAGVSIKVDHNCIENPVHYQTDGPLGDAYDCSICGAFIQVG